MITSDYKHASARVLFMINENKACNEDTLRFYGDEFVFNTVSGMSYRITSTAGFLLRNIIAGCTEDQLVGLMKEHYGLDQAAATRDVELLINNLADLEILS